MSTIGRGTRWYRRHRGRDPGWNERPTPAWRSDNPAHAYPLGDPFPTAAQRLAARGPVSPDAGRTTDILDPAVQ